MEQTHPSVDIIWNMWPLSMVVITPILVVLNVLFSPILLFTCWIPILWILVFKTFAFTLNLLFDNRLFIMIVGWSTFFLFGGLGIAIPCAFLILLNILMYPLIYTIPRQIVNILYAILAEIGIITGIVAFAGIYNGFSS